MSFGRIVALIFGVGGILAGLLIVPSAAAVLGVDREDGFVTTDAYTFERSSNAIVSEDIDVLTDAPAAVVDVFVDPVEIRITGSSADGSGLFLGIAPAEDVDAYLDAVAYDEIGNITFDGDEVTDVVYVRHTGAGAPDAPASQDFWEVSVMGAGTQSLEWDIATGNWTVVMMNADGSAGVEAELDFGFKISNLGAIAWSVLGFGVFSIVAGSFLVYMGVRTTPRIDRPQPPMPPPAMPPPSPGPSTGEVDLRDRPRDDE